MAREHVREDPGYRDDPRVGEGEEGHHEHEERGEVGLREAEQLEEEEQAATLCDGGCNPMRWGLQPYVMEAATLCGGAW